MTRIVRKVNGSVCGATRRATMNPVAQMNTNRTGIAAARMLRAFLGRHSGFRVCQPRRLMFIGPGPWQVGMTCTRLMFTRAGRVITQATTSAMSSALSGSAPS